MDPQLLEPISDTAPCGDNLAFSSEFDAIQEMRREDDPSLDQGEWVTTLKVADWRGVEALAGKLLATRTKDLRLAMWWCDAAARNRGYAGLAEGLELCGRLCERYWADLYPEGEDGEWDQRIGNLGWLLQRVVFLAPMLPVTQAKSGSFSLRDHAAARALQTQIEKSPHEADQLSEGKVTLDAFLRAQRETPQAWLLACVASIRASVAALAELQRVADERLGDEGPSFVAAREALASTLHEVERMARESGAMSSPSGTATADVTADSGSAAQAAETPSGPATIGGPIRSRAQALNQLREVADYFRRTEPHSPVAYLADKAARWGEMPLHLWLKTVLKDQGSLAHLEELLGLEGQDQER
ncbi:type VI secretion system protein TssA [Aquabacterium sp. A7-Y]|uniref:type VI secretion system protein TssA n=1 Tax=Aquabacterium sp. A7-Y TaxID=1349605 RepID=UPI00223DFCAE|nr:type VI secretion system protein TssA [Aquabacterium sp. A7-Y]MCW7537691.1 type VI secretion system protein TssA [Aquabacterium sp. A7-Y]